MGLPPGSIGTSSVDWHLSDAWATVSRVFEVAKVGRRVELAPAECGSSGTVSPNTQRGFLDGEWPRLTPTPGVPTGLGARGFTPPGVGCVSGLGGALVVELEWVA